MDIRIDLPLTEGKARTLHAGDTVLLSGTLYTARDAAHARLVDLINRGEELPIPIQDAVIYYVGPTPPRPGQVIGSAGPTTSYRMDAYSPQLIKLGLRGMLGKGRRSPEVVEAMKTHGAVYLGAIGGAAALLSKCIIASEIVCYEDLGAEAIRRLTVQDFPATVVIDTQGNSLFETGVQAYLESQTS